MTKDKVVMGALKLAIFTIGAGWAAFGLLADDASAALPCLFCAALTMHGMWNT